MNSDDQFGNYVSDYDLWYENHRAAYLSELEALRQLLPPSSQSLEVGVGSARFAAPLKVKWGMDPVREMLKLARARGVTVVQGRGASLPFKSGFFDCVLMVFTLCFAAEPKRLVDEAHRVLRRGGYLILGIVDRKSFLGERYEARKKQSKFYGSARFFSVSEVMELLPENGWKEIEIVQTVFDPPEKISKVQAPQPGSGAGAVVVIRAEKTWSPK